MAAGKPPKPGAVLVVLEVVVLLAKGLVDALKSFGLLPPTAELEGWDSLGGDGSSLFAGGSMAAEAGLSWDD